MAGRFRVRVRIAVRVRLRTLYSMRVKARRLVGLASSGEGNVFKV